MRNIVIILLSLGCFVISCNNNNDYKPRTNFEMAQHKWGRLQEGDATWPEELVKDIDYRLEKAGKTRADLGMTDEKIEEAISKCYIHEARERWAFLVDADEKILRMYENPVLEDMDEALAKAGKTRVDIGVTPDRFEVVMRNYHHKAARHYWLKMVEEYENGWRKTPELPKVVEYHLASLGMTREEFRIPEKKWNDIVLSIENKQK